jgi:lycopene beta-cyclase
MKKIYDLIVIGAGLSSLMFLKQYLKKTNDQKILLLEQKDNINSDQTFCVWDGPGLPSVTDEFQLNPKKIWKKIVLSSLNYEIKRDTQLYSYVCFDGKEALESLSSSCNEKITTIKNEKVSQIDSDENIQVVTTNSSTHFGKIIVDSRNNIKQQEIKSPLIHQAFVGSEIELTKERFNPDEVTLMSFIKKENQIEFIYILPFTKKRALVETTVFSIEPDLKAIENTHKEILKTYEPYRKIRQEKAIIPMVVISPFEEKRILKIGIGGGMMRASSGYSMRRVANWAIKIGERRLSEDNISTFRHRSNKWLNYLDKIFLNVILKYPEKGPYLFMKLFKRAKMPPLIRFLSDKPSGADLINILLCMPKRLMLKGLAKKKHD